MDDPTLATVTEAVAVPHLNTLAEAARKLRRSKSWLAARIQCGEIRTVRLSARSVFVTDAELVRFLDSYGQDDGGDAA